MRSKIPIPTQRKCSKEISNTREHPKTPIRLAKSNVFFPKGNSNGYGGRIADKNDAITDDAQKGYMNGNENMHDHQKGVINNDVNISGENMTEEFHNEENNVYVRAYMNKEQ